MKKIIILILSLLSTAYLFTQNKFITLAETTNNIEVSYKISHLNFFDKNSPAVMIFKLKNNNSFDVQVSLQIEYHIGISKKYKSEIVNVCIPSGRIIGGRMHGLMFELKTTDLNIFDSEENEWFFSIFKVEQIEKCYVNKKN